MEEREQATRAQHTVWKGDVDFVGSDASRENSKQFGIHSHGWLCRPQSDTQVRGVHCRRVREATGRAHWSGVRSSLMYAAQIRDPNTPTPSKAQSPIKRTTLPPHSKPVVRREPQAAWPVRRRRALTRRRLADDHGQHPANSD